MSLMKENLTEIRNYAKEELEKVREEMQQFARVLDKRFSNEDISGPKLSASGRKSREQPFLQTEIAIENTRDEMFKQGEKFK